MIHYDLIVALLSFFFLIVTVPMVQNLVHAKAAKDRVSQMNHRLNNLQHPIART